jgi:hypothetical protein
MARQHISTGTTADVIVTAQIASYGAAHQPAQPTIWNAPTIFCRLAGRSDTFCAAVLMHTHCTVTQQHNGVSFTSMQASKQRAALLQLW